MVMILSAFASRFGELLFDLAKEEVEMLWGVHGEIKKLQNKLRMISEVLVDAERRRINDRAIDYWLKQLEDIMYDADDILDRCRIEADKRSEGSSSTSSVRFSFPFLSSIRKLPVDHEIGTKIRELNQKLEEIWKWRSEFNLELTSPDMQQVTSPICRKTSPVVEIDIVGSRIEEDTQSLVDLLIKDDSRKNILVFAIVGAGGIGKTTLAQRIYNDQRIQEKFSVKKWVCVSREFDEIKLLKDILDGDENDRARDQSRSSLDPRVQSNLRGKKLFLVLDDVWTANVWCDLLRNTLYGCAAGSRVLVTTRNERIAMQMMAVNTHHVDKLSLGDGWSLLCKKVVLTGEEGEIQHLKDIGMEIVKKCDGLPLAIKVVAGVLCAKEKTRRAWNRVLESTAWSTSGLPEEVMGALYLSYEDLPSYLKQCFVYCSLFPEDHQIEMDYITKLWIAEGFVKAEGSSTMEETAKEYYRELTMRNLLQANFRVHDLLHCLARHMARDESLVLTNMHKVGGSDELMKLRRAFVPRYKITDNEITEIYDVLIKHDSLRTLLWHASLMSETRMDVVFDKLSRLRVLDLSFTEIERLPDSLGNLIYLRYLNISCSKISVIPESIGNLRNLRFLEMRECQHISRLPNGIVNLHNLRSLTVNSMKGVGMPAGLGRLQNLHTLREFNPPSNRAEGWCTIEELRSLSCLTDLSIGKLERISSSSEARAAELRNKPKLGSLRLSCSYDLRPSEEEMKRIEVVFEALHPPPCLEELEISDYFGHEFPKWMAETSPSASILFPNLRHLSLLHCGYHERLPPCGLLPNLEHLAIWGAASVIDVGPEFLVGTNSSTSSADSRMGVDTSKYAFPRLETLVFRCLPNWQDWHWDKGTKAMPCLNYLWLDDCPKLMSLPEGLLLHATSLTKLDISFATSLTTIENLLSLKELIITVAPKLEKLSDLPALTILQVAYCPELRVVENLQSLKRMKLINYDMKSLPSYLLKGVQTGIKKRKRVEIAHLEKLEIMCSSELARNICHRASSEWPKIQDIQQVHVSSEDGPVLVYNKSPFSFTTEFEDTSSSSSSGMPSSSSGINP
ncbi:putative disease resistance protein RGA3 [Elaeis guineensis]|uniref:Disease resistance protein RGA3 n=1 Tax=Elaeis guineensis var. tenera TaxID=51953 RepID=A0A6I9QBQ8_ELAGV|nr:putative disease resistance protein RGA3 [Elaeis guineensis]XP_019702118.1 putative disease resistance protein RGA3 [Elaeis guineensis]XP_019702119.1 putative disease resistance protein RGA3 [Elaeis guineensis]